MRSQSEDERSAGTVTRLAIQPKPPHHVAVFLDGALAFEVSQDLLLEFGLRVGRTLSPAEQEHLTTAAQLLAARGRALQYVAARARTGHEVRQKLRQSGFTEEVVQQAVDYLYARGYVNDAAYAHTYLKVRLDTRGDGPQRIRRDLQRRGIQREVIDETLQHSLTPEDTLAAARTQAARRWHRLSNEADPFKRRKKLADFLHRRGFSFTTVQQVVRELEQGAE